MVGLVSVPMPNGFKKRLALGKRLLTSTTRPNVSARDMCRVASSGESTGCQISDLEQTLANRADSGLTGLAIHSRNYSSREHCLLLSILMS